MIYHIFPFRIGAYIQDKLEFQGFIANLGVRLDYSDPNSKRYVLDNYDKYFRAGYGNNIEGEVTTEDAKPDWSINPRLGISHPITLNSKLYFNYGHFQSEPDPSYRFRIQRESTGLVTSIGDPNLKFEKTVAYELGFAQNLFNMMLLNVAAYYKDVSNQIGWIWYQNINNSVQYNIATNNNYADIRGFEITLTKQAGRWVTGFINYTYDVSTSGYFGLRENYEDPNKQRAYLRLNPYESRPHPQPYARANIDLHTPKDFGPMWMGMQPLGNWMLSILADWRVGSYYTYNPNKEPGIVDDTKWKDWYNIDLRISKSLNVSKSEVQFYVDITNALNTKYMIYAGFSDDKDWFAYLESLNFSWEKGVEKGNDRIGDYRPNNVPYDPLEPNPDNDPDIKKRNDGRKKNKSYIDMPNIQSFTFLSPRDFTFGIRINF
jgi:outer membrane receptor protein involved in Fe transport